MIDIEVLDTLGKMNTLLEKINRHLELLTNPVFVYDSDTQELRPMQQRPGSVIPLCKCGGLVEEKRDDRDIQCGSTA